MTPEHANGDQALRRWKPLSQGGDQSAHGALKKAAMHMAAFVFTWA
jgi:hypothetical protein